MNFIFSSILFFMVSALPEEYQYNNHKIYIDNPISEKKCIDISLIRVTQSDKKLDYILSYCKKKEDNENNFIIEHYRLFNVEKKEEISLKKFLRLYPSKDLFLSSGSKRLFISGNFFDIQESQEIPFFWIIQNGKIFPMQNFLSSKNKDNFLFLHKKNIYLLWNKGEKNNENLFYSKIIKITTPSNHLSKIPWNSFEITHEFPILITRVDAEKNRYGFYNLQNKEWIIYPLENKNKCESISNGETYIDFTYPEKIKSSENKIFFEIYLDGKLLKRTDFFIEGDDYSTTIPLKNGKNIIKLKKFKAKTIQGGEKKYVPSRNIEQLYPITLQRDEDFHYYIFIERVSNGEKPYILKKIRCQ